MRDWRFIACSAGAAVAIGAVFWLVGESVDTIGPYREFILLFAAPAMVLAVALLALARTRRSAVLRVVIAMILAAVAPAGLLLGHLSFNQAYNTCVGQGDLVRMALGDYKRHNGNYPQRLEQLALERLPCRRRLLGTLLHYSSSGQHYVLSFSDKFVTWETTDETSWSVSK